MDAPRLYIIIPCYNEEEVLPITCGMFLEEVNSLAAAGKIRDDSRILFVNDGSKDRTWEIITELARQDEHYIGISQSRNRGQQNCMLAGYAQAMDRCDACVTIDCDGQDDVTAIESMVDAYLSGCDVVYGVRSSRETDTFFKRFTAQSFYKVLNWMGVEAVYDHSEYRLLSNRVLHELENFKEVNLFLRGMIPLIGFKSTCVYFERKERMAGESKYPLRKMLALAFDGITSLSVKPIRMIASFGFLVALISLIGIIWAVVNAFTGSSVAGWASIICVVCFIGGIQMLCLGVIGEYIGKIYLETKHRPRFIISERTWEDNPNEQQDK